MCFRLISLALLIVIITGCAGLRQFPDVSVRYAKDLDSLDPDFNKLLDTIYSGTTAETYRNKEIEKRLRVIDIHFEQFLIQIGQENVGANLAVNVVSVGSGVSGALVSGGTSQILSGVSAFLAGSQQAYDKEVLFDRALPALLQQMVATRTAVKVRIVEGMSKSINEYTLAQAMEDIDAYLRAGSIPGSVSATSEDAQKKKADALEKLRVSPYSHDNSAEALSELLWPGGDRTRQPIQANVDWLRKWIDRQPDITDLPIQKLLDNPALSKQREMALKELKKHLEDEKTGTTKTKRSKRG